jgi:hypothetical protein
MRVLLLVELADGLFPVRVSLLVELADGASPAMVSLLVELADGAFPVIVSLLVELADGAFPVGVCRLGTPTPVSSLIETTAARSGCPGMCCDTTGFMDFTLWKLTRTVFTTTTSITATCAKRRPSMLGITITMDTVEFQIDGRARMEKEKQQIYGYLLLTG